MFVDSVIVYIRGKKMVICKWYVWYVIERRLDRPFFFFFQAEDGIRDDLVTGVQTCALPISSRPLTFSFTAGRSRLFRRPAIRLRAGPAHQHCAFAVAQAVGLAERLDGLLVVDDGEGASPVGTPQAAFETPRVEHAGERFPDVRERIRFPG